MRGAALNLELRRWNQGETLSVPASDDLGEELGAVLEGRFELVCGDEHHELASGEGILIPPHEPRQWRVLSASGVLYRVLGPP